MTTLGSLGVWASLRSAVWAPLFELVFKLTNSQTHKLSNSPTFSDKWQFRKRVPAGRQVNSPIHHQGATQRCRSGTSRMPCHAPGPHPGGMIVRGSARSCSSRSAVCRLPSSIPPALQPPSYLLPSTFYLLPLFPFSFPPYLPEWMRSTEISAGLTPLMRLAWPMVRGRRRESFSRASLERPPSWW